ncbi:MAG TPA: response regulator [Nitrospira sp.]|nr:response regulator [Nitrospira sp.]
MLLAEIHPKLLNSLFQTLNDTIPDLTIDVCTSSDQVRSKLVSRPYQMIIANANLAVMDGGSLLKYYQSSGSHAPFLVSIRSSEQALARQAVEAGAFDVLLNPIDVNQIEKIVRPALWLYQLRVTIHLRQERIRQYKERLAASSIISPAHRQNLKQNYLDIEEAYRACQRSIDQIEVSLRYLENSALDIEAEARQRTCREYGLSDKP